MENKNYLKEDLELVEELIALEPGNAYNVDQRKSQKLASLQIQALLRTRKTYKDASDTQDRFNWVLFIFTAAQVLIAMLTLTYQIFAPKDLASEILIFILFIGSVLGVFWVGFREIKEPKKN